MNYVSQEFLLFSPDEVIEELQRISESHPSVETPANRYTPFCDFRKITLIYLQ